MYFLNTAIYGTKYFRRYSTATYAWCIGILNYFTANLPENLPVNELRKSSLVYDTIRYLQMLF